MVKFFGDKLCGWYDKDSKDLLPFDENYHNCCAKKSRLFRQALSEANAEKAAASSIKPPPKRALQACEPRSSRLRRECDSISACATIGGSCVPSPVVDPHLSQADNVAAAAAPEGDVYTVRQVLGLRVKAAAGRPCLMFKIWWQGFPKARATEEPEHNLSPELVRLWKMGHEKQWRAAMVKAAQIEVKRVQRPG